MCPCLTTMNVQKAVYIPRFAVRGSGMKCPLLSTLVTAVEPGLCDQNPFLPFRNQWKSMFGAITNATRCPSGGHLLFAPGWSSRLSFTAAGRTEAQVSCVYIAPAAFPG